MKRCLLIAAAVLLIGCGKAQSQEAPEARGHFEVTGLGGGGGTFTPTVSPYDSNLLFLSCDMSGVYRSTDRGKTWSLIHYKYIYGALGCRPAFTKKAMYWVCADYGSNLRVSHDQGITWKKVIEGEAPWKTDSVTHLAATDTAPDVILVGTASGLWTSADAGTTWKQTAEGKCAGITTVGTKVWAALQTPDAKGHQALLHSTDAGKTWKTLAVELAKGNPITAVAVAEGRNGDLFLLLTVENVGILKAGSGRQWGRVMDWDGQRDVLIPAGQTDVAYACQVGGGSQKIWRTADGGKTWPSLFHMYEGERNVELAWVQKAFFWSYYILPNGLGIDPNDPDVVLVTLVGDFYRSENGGKTWQPIMNRPVGVKPGDPGFRYASIGLEVTVAYDVAVDPFEPNRHYAGFADIGFGRSVDAGETWITATKGSPWVNTFYQIAFDPFVKGRIYAACSNRHDVSGWGMEANQGPYAVGGVCVSDDFGATWRVLNKDLPNLPATSIVVDPKSTKDRLTMYTTLYEDGVYKTTDGGKTWTKKARGLGNPPNLHSCRVRIHPKSGNLYCLVTGLREGFHFPAPGGVWKSTDGGESWHDVTVPLKLDWPTDFAVHPTDENVMYVSAGTVPRNAQGGIYKTTDGGKTWKRLLADEDFAKWCTPTFVHGSVVRLHPDNPGFVYFGSATHGLWFSKDAGATWTVFKNFPFKAVMTMTFDPADPTVMYVGTGGAGVLKGYALPVNEGSPF